MRAGMDIYFLTIFPDMFREPLAAGMTGIAEKNGAVRYHVINLRDFAEDRYGSVDDYPYGGGPGMILMAPPILKAVESVRPPDEGADAPVILLSPCGKVFDQAKANELATKKKLVFICGRYKGVDERVRDLVVTESISIGDYILSGGELAALVVTDAVVASSPRSPRRRAFARDRFVHRRAGILPRRGVLHEAARVQGARGARGASLGKPCANRRVEDGIGARTHAPVQARSHVQDRQTRNELKEEPWISSIRSPRNE